MASIDPDTGELVVRIAYDGATRAGKTTNIAKLGEKLKKEVFTPEQLEGSTLYFDWMKYKGGSFEGLPIRCELVTVPGQELLNERRLMLLEQADVVVEVFDLSLVTPQDIRAKVREIRDASDSPCPRKAIVQLNKCDLKAKTPVNELQALCEEFDPPVRCVKAVATVGRAVHETFIYAVRASLERVRELRKLNLLPSKKDLDGPGLLTWIKAHETPAANLSLTATPGLDAKLQTQDTASLPPHPSPAPALPSTKPKPEKVWSPNIDQALFDEIDFTQCDLEAAGPDAWYGALGDWHLYSSADCLFENELQGAQAMLAWGQHCSSLQALLSSPRYVILAPVDADSSGGSGQWRLWQLVAAQPTLRDEISMILDEQDLALLASRLCETGVKLLEMESKRREYANLPDCSIDSVGTCGTQVQHVGFLASPPAPQERSNEPLPDQALLRQEFSSIMAHDWPQAHELCAELEAIAKSSADPRTQSTASLLAGLLSEAIDQAPPVVLVGTGGR